MKCECVTVNGKYYICPKHRKALVENSRLNYSDDNCICRAQKVDPKCPRHGDMIFEFW